MQLTSKMSIMSGLFDTGITAKALFKRFLIIYLPIFLILSIILSISIHLDEQNRLEKAKVQEASRIEIAKERVTRDLSAVDTDLRVIVHLPLLREYLDSDDPAKRKSLEKILLDLARETRRYDQIRYLDAKGHEVIRVNYNNGKPVVVSPDKLQNKSGRYYFEDTIRLDKGEIFVSPLDLNVEHGRVETPYKPMIRYGTPVFDSKGVKKGIIMLNYLGKELLQNFREVMHGGNPHSGMLLNRDGYWLSSKDPETEWGFMLGRNKRTFGNDFPEVWKTISAANHGSLLTDRGLFVYTSAYPLLGEEYLSTSTIVAKAKNAQESMKRKYYWKIVSLLPRNILFGDAIYNQPIGRVLIVAIYLLAALASLFVAGIALSRMRAKEALHDNAIRMRTILSTVADGIITINDHGIVESINPAAEQLFGYDATEVIGQNVKVLMAEPHHSLHDEYIHRYCSTGHARVIGMGREVEGQGKDGSIFPMDLLISEMQLNGRRFFTGIVRDITERKQTQQNLVDAKEKAELANRAKSSFLSTMSHEIRTPLSGMLGMLEVLSLTKLDREQKQTLQIAWDSSRNLLRIVNDILDWSKIEAGKLELMPHPTSIPQLLQGVVSTYSYVASAKGLMLLQHTDVRLSPAHIVDGLRLAQVLNNFVSNAIKFTEKGEVELRADLIQQVESGERIRFSVRDTGIGIEKGIQQQLFRRYQQESADTARLYGGTGLGLAICQRLADLMNGTVGLESEPGRGSTFTITLILPISAAPGETVEIEDLSVGGRKTTAPLFDDAEEAPLVLVADDHPTNRDLLVRQLKLLGLRSETATNGREALQMWHKQGFDLIITDCHMPEMDGYTLSRVIRKTEGKKSSSHTPIIAWTANALPEEKQLCREAGMDELLVKPTDLSQLRKVLTTWLSVVDTKEEKPATTKPGPDAGQPSEPIDYAELMKIVPDKGEHLQVLSEFQTHIRADRAKLMETLEQNDAIEVERTAHRMKGASRMVGAIGLANICDSIEQKGRNGKLDAVRSELTSLDKQIKILETHLDERNSHE